MSKIFITIVFISLTFLSCKDKNDDKICSISENYEFIVESKRILEMDSLISIQDIVIIDSLTVITYYQSDTVLRIYKNLDFSQSMHNGIQGNGPKDIIPVVFLNKAVDFDTISLFEIHARRIKKIFLNKTHTCFDYTAEFVRDIMPFIEFNETKNYICGLDVERRNIFTYNKHTQVIIKFDYYPKPDRKYDDERLIFLYECELIANEQKKSICAAMRCINSIVFYNFEGEIQKTIVIGDKLKFPAPHPVYLDFAHENIYFTGVTSTANYVYCLYRNAASVQTISDSVLIFVFSWEGEHITTIKTNGNIWNIAVSRYDEYILGKSCRNSFSSTDIVKIPLEGILPK